MKKLTTRNRGFMEIITIVIVGVAALAYFNVDLRGILHAQIFQKILSILKDTWLNYLVPLGGHLKTSIISLFN